MINKKLALKLMTIVLGIGISININPSTVSANAGNTKQVNMYQNKVTLKRLVGKDRFETCLKVFDEFSSIGHRPDTIILANAFNYADAVASAPLTKKYNAPIMITGADKLEPRIEAKIKSANIKKVIIVGGTGSISSNIKNHLKSKGLSVERVGGKDRTETSIKIAEKIEHPYGVILVDGFNGFTNALSLSTESGIWDKPIILTNDKDDLSFDDIPGLWEYIQTHKDKSPNPMGFHIGFYMKNFKPNLMKERHENIYGGRSVGNIYRDNLNIVGGQSGFETPEDVIMTSATDFPDSLCASALAIKLKAPIVYAGGKREEVIGDILKSSNWQETLKWNFYDNYLAVKNIYYLGGEKLVPDNSYKKLTGNW